MTTLRVDWATAEATRFACERWHYAASVPPGKTVKVGAWEDGRFIGVVLFARGASPWVWHRYGIGRDEGAELVRVALTDHATPVSRIIALAIKRLRVLCPGLRLLVSFADANRGHHGGIYQAGGWIYSGETEAKKFDYLTPDGRRIHDRSVTSSGWCEHFGRRSRCLRPEDCTPIPLLAKHRYLFPLDAAMREQVLPLALPYPKRADDPNTRAKDQAAGFPPALGGETPTRALQLTEG